MHKLMHNFTTKKKNANNGAQNDHNLGVFFYFSDRFNKQNTYT